MSELHVRYFDEGHSHDCHLMAGDSSLAGESIEFYVDRTRLFWDTRINVKAAIRACRMWRRRPSTLGDWRRSALSQARALQAMGVIEDLFLETDCFSNQGNSTVARIARVFGTVIGPNNTGQRAPLLRIPNEEYQQFLRRDRVGTRGLLESWNIFRVTFVQDTGTEPLIFYTFPYYGPIITQQVRRAIPEVSLNRYLAERRGDFVRY